VLWWRLIPIEAIEDFAVTATIGGFENRGHKTFESLIETHRASLNEDQSSCGPF
jgi:hypothetical protein